MGIVRHVLRVMRVGAVYFSFCYRWTPRALFRSCRRRLAHFSPSAENPIFNRELREDVKLAYQRLLANASDFGTGNCMYVK